MSDVGMREKNAIEVGLLGRVLIRGDRQLVQLLKLMRKVWRGFEHPALFGNRVDQCQTSHRFAQGWIGPGGLATIAATTRMRVTGILGCPEYHEVG